MRRYRLAQPQRGSQVDVDHEPQRLGSRGERVSRAERADGVHQHVRGPNLAGDPADEAFRCGGVGGVGYLAADTVGGFTQGMLVPVDGHEAPPHDPHQPTALIIINLTHTQAICHRPSLPESRPPERQGKRDLLWH